MFRSLFTVLFTLILALGILTTSVFRASTPRYSFSETSLTSETLGIEDTALVDYELSFPGGILPDHPLWPVAATKDRLWFWFTLSPEGKAQVSQILADKRLVASRKLFEEGKAEIGFSTLVKAENYLRSVLEYAKEAEREGKKVDALLEKHARASLRHSEEIKKILEIAPEDAKPGITRVGDMSINSFKEVRDALNEKGLSVPENPFDSN